jgi:hypothetical protein
MKIPEKVKNELPKKETKKIFFYFIGDAFSEPESTFLMGLGGGVGFALKTKKKKN